jgi:hypothetical protein
MKAIASAATIVAASGYFPPLAPVDIAPPSVSCSSTPLLVLDTAPHIPVNRSLWRCLSYAKCPLALYEWYLPNGLFFSVHLLIPGFSTLLGLIAVIAP